MDIKKGSAEPRPSVYLQFNTMKNVMQRYNISLKLPNISPNFNTF